MKMRTRVRILKVLAVLGNLVPIVAFVFDMWKSQFPKGTSEYIQRERIVIVLLIIWGVIAILIVILTCVGISTLQRAREMMEGCHPYLCGDKAGRQASR